MKVFIHWSWACYMYGITSQASQLMSVLESVLCVCIVVLLVYFHSARLVLSADSEEEKMQWIRIINHVVFNIVSWEN